MGQFGVNLSCERIVQAFIIGAADLADIATIDDCLDFFAKF